MFFYKVLGHTSQQGPFCLKWRIRLSEPQRADKISEMISHLASVQRNSVALDGSCQSNGLLFIGPS